MGNDYINWMKQAIIEAEKSLEINEVPVGSVIVKDGTIIGRGHNSMESSKNALKHAEIIAIEQAQEYMGDWRLEECILVCTLEPCIMCASAAVLSRIDTIAYGASDPKFGGCGSIVNIPVNEKLNHNITIIKGIMADETAQMMKDFFRKIRREKEV